MTDRSWVPVGPTAGIGIDIGGTKIAAAVVEFDGTQVRTPSSVRRVATPSGPTAILAACAALVAELRVEHAVAAVGVGAPGVIDGSCGVVESASAVIPGWAGTRVADVLGEQSGLPVRVENDVRAFARAEHALGAGRGTARCLYAAFGTGVGGAIALDGLLQDGQLHQPGGGQESPHGTAFSTVGEIAHLSVGAVGSPCGCGRRGHLESVACGPAMAAEYVRRTGAAPGTSLRDVGRAAATGDVEASGVIRDAASLAGEALAGLVCALDLDTVVLGGGATDVHPDFVRILTQRLAEAVWPRDRSVRIVRSRFGSAAPIIGAALLGLTDLQPSR